MFCARYFAARYFAPRYWPKIGETVIFLPAWASQANGIAGPVAPQPEP